MSDAYAYRQPYPDPQEPEGPDGAPSQDGTGAAAAFTPPAPARRSGSDVTDLSVGEILRRERLRYGKTLEDVEAMLRIRVAYLQAIEQGDHARLPGRVYAIGFVRSYAEYLGLDGARIIALFKRQASAAGSGIAPELNFPVPASENRVAGTWLFVTATLLAAATVAVWVVAGHPPRAPVNEIPEIPLQTRADIAPSLPAAAAPAPQVQTADTLEAAIRQQVASVDPTIAVEPVETLGGEAAAQEITAGAAAAATPEITMEATPAQLAGLPAADGAAGDHRIVLRAVESTWIEIRDAAGNALLSSILKAGDIYFVPDQPQLSLSTGNAGGFVIEIDGKAAGRLGETGDVRRDVSLEPESLSTVLTSGGR